jgi:diacylglycerol diphosphate phosphatase / phosphatidate phosphatase
VCTETDHHTLQDGWRSFPSGHSSFAFSGLGFLAIFLAGQLHVFRPHSDLTRGLIALAPLLGAAMIAISRCEDYRHDVYDVTIGSLLGLIVAHFSYRRYYPPLRSGLCDIPHPLMNDPVFSKEQDMEMGVRNAGDFELANDDSSEHLPLTSTRS